MKKNKGFTLVELLAVIVILSIVVVLATRGIMNSLNGAKKGTTNIAKQELEKLAEAYCATEGCSNTVSINQLYSAEYISLDTINPKTNKSFETESNINSSGITFTIDANGNATCNGCE